MMNLRQLVGDPPRPLLTRRTLNNDNTSNSFDHTTFEGMIRNSNQVLDLALSSRENLEDTIRPTRAERAIPHILFEHCEGILLLHVIEAAFLVGASVGTGLLMKHNRSDNSWSAPLATGLTGIGWGFMGGIARKDLVVFIMNKETMDTLTGDLTVNLGGQASLTIGERGREVDAALHASNKGVGATVAFSYSRGFLVGVSLEGSVVAPRTACNNILYGRPVTPQQVLDELEVPDSVKDLHAKLQTLAEPKKRIREPIVYQGSRLMQSRDDCREYDFVQKSESPDSNGCGQGIRQVPQSPADNEEGGYIMCQTLGTQTGWGDEDMEAARLDLPVEVSKATNHVATNSSVGAQTQTDECIVECQHVQTQTGGCNEAVTVASVEKMIPNDISISHVAAETQTGELVLLCNVAQTQTGDDDYAWVEGDQPVVEKIVSNNIPLKYQVVETQTEELAAMCRDAKTQTGGDDDEDVVMVEGPQIEKKTSNDIRITYKTTMVQTDEKDIVSQEVQTQTGGGEGDEVNKLIGSIKTTTAFNDVSIMHKATATQTEKYMEDLVVVSDDDEFVITNGDSGDEMDFVVMDAVHVEELNSVAIPRST